MLTSSATGLRVCGMTLLSRRIQPPLLLRVPFLRGSRLRQRRKLLRSRAHERCRRALAGLPLRRGRHAVFGRGSSAAPFARQPRSCGHAASEQLHELSPQGGLALELDELVGLQSVPLPCGAPTNTVGHRTPARTPHPAM